MPITTLIAIFLLILLWFLLSQKSSHSTNDKLARFWERPKYVTKWDIQKKYPKSKSLQEKSLERKRREAREKERLEAERKKQIIDRHLKAARDEVQANRQPISKTELKLLSSLFYDYLETCRLIEEVQASHPKQS
jgi:biopolymer transport protein ExbB/TolQ